MRLAVDARLYAYRRGGISQYTRQLLEAMVPQAPEARWLVLQHSSHERPLVVAPNVQRRTMVTPPHNRFEQWSLPLELLPLRPDLAHFPDFVVPMRRTFRAVSTVHDLAFLRYPDILDDDAKRFYGQVKQAVHSADAVITVSESTRQDMASMLDLPPERVDLIYEAAAPLYQPLALAPGSRRVINEHSLTADSFILFVSTLEPRKNLPTLFQTLKTCRERHPERRYKLVLAGARGWHDEPIFAAVRDLRLDDAVLFLGSVTPDDLLWLYNACRLYVNPSLYEGFGLPVLEALACGAPSLVANTSSLPEVAGGAAMLLPPLEVGAWADALERLWQDDDLRAEYARRGPAQAGIFSWNRAARETLAVYRRVLEH
ncbi:MAG: glycosyltransferase family 4 protein [Chloroflexaceae bacterium]|jgi:glycosyltransferase involved in cell wall biosynthesis|nr:glycosyltransferase family 4 protein [Chloroflexaceae bacterium]